MGPTQAAPCARRACCNEGCTCRNEIERVNSSESNLQQPIQLDSNSTEINRPVLDQPIPLNRCRVITIFVEGEPEGVIKLPSNTLYSIVELLPEPEPGNRLTRVLKDDYPL